MRFVESDRISFNNLPNYSYSRNTLLGLGGDITANVLSLMQSRYGATVKLSSATNVTNALAPIYGLINQYGATYSVGADGKAIPFASPVTKSFGTQEYEFYVQDTFKWTRNLTVTYGVRYSNDTVPYERNGIEGVSQTPHEPVLRRPRRRPGARHTQRRAAHRDAHLQARRPRQQGTRLVPARQQQLRAAPLHGVCSRWRRPDHQTSRQGQRAPRRRRLDLRPLRHRHGHLLRVLRIAGTFDHRLAAPEYRLHALRSAIPAAHCPRIPASTATGFPYTPPVVIGGFTSFSGVSSNLVAPYEYLLNVSYARPLVKKMTIEVGYIGRLSHKGLMQQDFAQPLTLFKDVKSGQTWSQAGTLLKRLYDSGITPAQVQANPSLIPQIPFFEDIFPGAKNYKFNGSASANYYYTVYGTYAGSDLDALNDMDRLRQSNGTCISVYGCNTFFANQAAGLTAWTNSGKSGYNGLQLVLRRPVTNGWGFDFNYTLEPFDRQRLRRGKRWRGRSGCLQSRWLPRTLQLRHPPQRHRQRRRRTALRPQQALPEEPCPAGPMPSSAAGRCRCSAPCAPALR